MQLDFYLPQLEKYIIQGKVLQKVRKKYTTLTLEPANQPAEVENPCRLLTCKIIIRSNYNMNFFMFIFAVSFMIISLVICFLDFVKGLLIWSNYKISIGI